MQDGLYVGLSSHLALERRLATVADNIANAGTPGFRATSVRFDAVLGNDGTAFVSTGREYRATEPGALVNTGNALDFAVEGDVWFAADTPAGPVMTRDGRFRLTAEGSLLSLEGHPILDPGGAPVQVQPQGGEIVAGRDGVLRQDGRIVGSLGLFFFNPPADAMRFGASGIVAGTLPEPAVDRRDAGILQGWVEQSNVDPLRELTRLIAIQRLFDSVATATARQEEGLNDTVKAMAG